MEYTCNTIDDFQKNILKFAKGRGDFFICSEEVWEYIKCHYEGWTYKGQNPWNNTSTCITNDECVDKLLEIKETK